MELFKLLGTIAIANVAKAQSDIDNTNNKASSLGQTFSKGVGIVAGWGAAVGGAAVAAGAGLVAFAKSSASTSDNIDKMSQKIGISREAYQQLDFICSQAGTSVDNFQTGIKTLTNQMQSAQGGTESAIEAFEKLGISIYDNNGELKDQETMMWETLDALQGVSNQTEKAALANDLFGRSGTELMPLLNGASGSIEEMKQKASELGLVLSNETIDAGVSMTDTIDQMERAFGAAATQLGGSLMPLVESVANIIIENMPTIQGLFQQISPILQSVFGILVNNLLELIQSLLPTVINLIMTLLPFMSQIFDEILPVIINLLAEIMPYMIQIIQELLPPLLEVVIALLPLLSIAIELLQPVLDLIVALAPNIATLISKSLVPLVETFVNLVDTIKENLLPAFYLIEETLEPVMGFVGELIGETFDNVEKIFSGIIDFINDIFAGDLEAAMGDIAGIIQVYVDSFVDFVKPAINGIIDLINGFTASLGKIEVPKWMTGIFGQEISFSIPQIPHLEKGGILEKGQMGFLEGNGAEAVVPLEKSDKWLTAMAGKMNAIQGGGNDAVVRKIDELITVMKSMNIVLDTGAMVGELTPALDASLGNLYVAKGRGR